MKKEDVSKLLELGFSKNEIGVLDAYLLFKEEPEYGDHWIVERVLDTADSLKYIGTLYNKFSEILEIGDYSDDEERDLEIECDSTYERMGATNSVHIFKDVENNELTLFADLGCTGERVCAFDKETFLEDIYTEKDWFDFDFSFRGAEFTIRVDFENIGTASDIRRNIIEKYSKYTGDDTFREFFLEQAKYYGLKFRFIA